jgi:hypothetical protein
MSILVFVLDLLINSIVAIDTLGLVVASRKDPNSVPAHDVWRLSFTWVCFAVLNSLMCCNCGFLGTLFGFIALAAKLWIGLPKLGGADKVQQMIGSGQLNNYVRSLVDLCKSKMAHEKAE